MRPVADGGRRRRAVVALFAAAFVVGIGLLLAGLHRLQLRAFVLRTQTAGVVATVKPGADVCEGPIRSPSPARDVVVYGQRVGNPLVEVVIRSPEGRTITSGVLPEGQPYARMGRNIPTARPIRVCVRTRGGELSLLGAGNGEAVAANFSTTRVAKGDVFAVLLERPSSLLGALGVAFSRAAVFRPSWMGAWTFWVLCGLLLSAVVVGAIGISSAVLEDEPSSRDS